MMNLIYKYNEDGTLKKSFEIKKIYIITIVSLVSIYVLNINPYFNNELDSFLENFGLNIWVSVGAFVFIGLFVFRLSHRFDRKLKRINFNNNQ